MITEEQLAKYREPIPYIPVKQLRRDRPLYVMKQTRPHPIRGYGNSHDEFSVVDIRGYRKGYEPRLDILGQYTPNPHDLFRLGTGRLPPYQPTATGDKLQAEMERLQVHKAWRINPIARGNPIPKELDLARTLAIIDSRPKGRIIESKLREEFGDAIIDALRQGRYVVSGSAGYNPPLLVSLKGRELIQGGNPKTPTYTSLQLFDPSMKEKIITAWQKNRVVFWKYGTIRPRFNDVAVCLKERKVRNLISGEEIAEYLAKQRGVTGQGGSNPTVKQKAIELMTRLGCTWEVTRAHYPDWGPEVAVFPPEGYTFGGELHVLSCRNWEEVLERLQLHELVPEASSNPSSEGGNPMGKVITKEEAIGLLERLSMTPGEAARSLVADEAERREIMQTVQQRVKGEQNKWAPMDPREGPPLPRIFAGLRWPWKK